MTNVNVPGPLPTPVDPPVPVRVSDIATSLIRTWVPIAVGALIAWLTATTHTIIPAHASAAAGVLASGIVASGYYALARLLEGAGVSALRTLGRVMLGGVVPPVYVSEAERLRILR